MYGLVSEAVWERSERAETLSLSLNFVPSESTSGTRRVMDQQVREFITHDRHERKWGELIYEFGYRLKLISFTELNAFKMSKQTEGEKTQNKQISITDLCYNKML